MLLYMEDYVNSLIGLDNKHFDSSSVKHRFPSQNPRLSHRIGKHPRTLFRCSVTVLAKQYGRKYRSCISVKILILAYVEQNLGRSRDSG